MSKVVRSSPAMAWMSGLGAVVIGLIFYRQMSLMIRNEKKGGTKKKRRPIPRNPEGLVNTVVRMSQPDAHMFFLEESEKLKSLVYRIMLPVFPDPNVYVVGHPSLIREILSDPQTDKAIFLYEAFKPLTFGLETIFTSSTTSLHWKAVRKGTAPAFTKEEVKRMN